MPRLALTVTAVAVLALAAGAAFPEDEAAPKPLSVRDMEARMFQLGAPCPQHEVLKRFVGTWDNEGTAHSEVMGTIPIRGTTTFRSLLGGRFVESRYEGPPGPMGTIAGTGRMGFNRLIERFESTWMMSMGTSIELLRGTWDAETNTMTLLGEKPMPNGETWPVRRVLVFESDDRIVETSYMTPTITGKEQLGMTLTYTRRKDAPAAK